MGAPGQFKPKKQKPPIVNQQKVVYAFNRGLCDAVYVGFMSRHFNKRLEEHKRSTMGNYVKKGRDPRRPCITNNFKILKTCQSKLTV